MPIRPLRMWRFVGFLGLALCLMSSLAYGEPAPRYGLVIGANEGEPDEVDLLYAERDAARVADVLTRLVKVPAQNLILLKGPDREEVESVLEALARRIAADKSVASAPPLLFVYYSGHADASSLHLGGTRLSFRRFKEGVAAVGAEASIFVVDACRSGALTRVKGARPAEPFEIRAEDGIESTGLAIITSSAAGEDAQESDRLRGGIFTHHFLTGLHGAADSSRDRRITLSEAYRYAYFQTLRTTTRTRFVQHPTYAFRMKGRQELVLATTSEQVGLGRLHLLEAGRYVVLEQAADGAVAAELQAEANTNLLMPAGTYLVRRRSRRAVEEMEVVLTKGGISRVSPEAMVRLPYGRTVRKGLDLTREAVWSLGGSVELTSSILDEDSLGLYGSLDLQLDLRSVALELRARYGRSSASNEEMKLGQDMIGLDFSVLHLFDVEATDLAFGLGVLVGGDVLMQSFDTRGLAPERTQVVGRVAPVFRVEWTPSATLILGLDCGAEIYLLQRERSGTAAFETPVVPFCTLGFGAYLL